MSEPICGVLTDPIRSEIIRLGAEAERLTRPMPSYEDVVGMCVAPDDIATLKRAYVLVGGRGNDTLEVRLRDVDGGLEDFKINFHIDANMIDMMFPRYATDNYLPARGTIEAQARILPSIIKQYYLVGRMRVALEVFDRLNVDFAHDDLTIAHLRYHLDWLPGIMRTIAPQLKSRYDNSGRSRSERYERSKRKEQRDLSQYWVGKLDDTSERYHWSLPVEYRPLVTEASAAMATIAVLQRANVDTSSKTGVRTYVKVPRFVTQSGEFEALSGFAMA